MAVLKVVMKRTKKGASLAQMPTISSGFPMLPTITSDLLVG